VRIADIPPERLAALNAGTAETRVLAEALAIDIAALIDAALPGLGAASALAPVAGITRRMAAAGRLLAARLGADAIAALVAHPSDTLRGIACFALAERPARSIAERLAATEPFAEDAHFGVREWAWLALRPHVAADVPAALAALRPWTARPSERARRFAAEATRPRGVWSAHLAALRADPRPGLAILAPLRADPSRYVQDSVANWLNDAAKDHPAWVSGVVQGWLAEADAPATLRIARRATRSVTPARSP
jgi:3-methyladenine DNA glycosylase AlkC